MRNIRNFIIFKNALKTQTSTFSFNSFNSSLLKTTKKSFCKKLESSNPSTSKSNSFLSKWDFKKYGTYGTVIYLSTFAVCFPSFYFLIKYKYISKDWLLNFFNNKGYDVQKYVTKFGETKVDLAYAYLCLFVTKPFRIAFTCLLAGYLINRKNRVSSPKIKKEGKLKQLAKTHGKKILVLYTLYWIFTGISLYFLIKNNIIDKSYAEGIIKKWEWTSKKYENLKTKYGENAINLSMAIILNELFEVVRLPTFLLYVKFFIKK